MRVLIADSQPKVRFALRVTLEQRPGNNSISEAIDAEDLLAQAHLIRPDLVLIDRELLGMPLVDILTQLYQTCGNVRTIVLSSRAETRDQAMAAGANAFVCECDGPDRLLSAIETCLAQTDDE